MPKTPLVIEVFKGHTRRYRSILRRADGVEVELDGGACNRLGARELPHDMLVRVVCDAAGAGRVDLRARTGERWWSAALTEAAVARALDRLGRAADEWVRLAPGGSLRFTWRLVRKPARGL